MIWLLKLRLLGEHPRTRSLVLRSMKLYKAMSLKDYERAHSLMGPIFQDLSKSPPLPYNLGIIEHHLIGGLYMFRGKLKLIQSTNETKLRSSLDDFDHALTIFRSAAPPCDAATNCAKLYYQATMEACKYSEGLALKTATRATEEIRYAMAVADQLNLEDERNELEYLFTVLDIHHGRKDDRSIKKNIRFLEQYLSSFESHAYDENAQACAFHLLRAYSKPQLKSYSQFIEKGISLSREILKGMYGELDHDMHIEVLSIMATLFADRIYGDQESNIQKSAALYNIAIIESSKLGGKKKYARLIGIYAEHIAKNDSLSHLKKEAKSLLNKTLKEVQSFPLSLAFILTQSKFRLETAENQTPKNLLYFKNKFEDFLNLLDSNSDFESWYSCHLSLIHIFWLEDRATAASKSLPLYYDLLAKAVAHENHRYTRQISQRIGSCYLRLDNPVEALCWFKKGLHDLGSSYFGDNKSSQSGDYRFSNNIHLLRDAYISALNCGESKTALFWHDTFHSRSSTLVLEDWLVIDRHPDRENLASQYYLAKSFEWSIRHPEGIHADIAERLGNIINQADDQLDRLKSSESFIGRSKFFNELEDHLSNFSSWLLVPIMGDESLWLVLIEPDKSGANLHCHEFHDVSLKDLYSLASGGEDIELGLLSVINDFRRFEELDQEELKHLSIKLARPASYIWRYFLEWPYEKMKDSGIKDPNLTIITTGPMALLPFGMAWDKDFIPAAQKMHVQLEPSLYAAYANEMRKQLFEEREANFSTLAFIEQESDKGDEPDLSTSLELALIRSAFPAESVNHLAHQDEKELRPIIDTCFANNYWHFSGHGEFSWQAGKYSQINLGIGLRQELLVLLGNPKGVRLAVFSSCESAMYHFTDPEQDIDGILFSLLRQGALGVIGALWSIPDISASLFFGRFYYYHITHNESPQRALTLSQRWLMMAKIAEIQEFIQSNSDHSESENAIQKALDAHNTQDIPFSHPVFWAGYFFVGQ